jgi:hypothetical protein
MQHQVNHPLTHLEGVGRQVHQRHGGCGGHAGGEGGWEKGGGGGRGVEGAIPVVSFLDRRGAMSSRM